MRHKSKMKLSGGFTLLESLISIAIILIAISASFSIVPQGQIAIQNIRNQMIASYSAQEALEIVRNKRDNGMLFNGAHPSLDWLSEIPSDCISPSDADPNNLSKCSVNALNDGELILCSGLTSCPKLRYIDSNPRRLYGNGSFFDADGVDTIFTRWVTIQRVTNDTAVAWEETAYGGNPFNECADPNNLEVKVTAHLEWQDGSRTRQFVLSENLMWWGIKFVTSCP